MIKVQLASKPIPVPLIYQPVYKLVMLLSVLRYGTRKPYKAPTLTLHLYLWSLRSDENFSVLKEVSSKGRNTLVPWTFEPALNKTIILGLVNNYCTRVLDSKSLQIQLTDNGKDFLESIERLEIFDEDISKIKQIGIIPKNLIEEINKTWVLR